MTRWLTVICVGTLAGTAFKLGPEYFVCFLAGAASIIALLINFIGDAATDNT